MHICIYACLSMTIYMHILCKIKQFHPAHYYSKHTHTQPHSHDQRHAYKHI